MDNRDWQPRPDAPRRFEGTAGWRVVDRPRSAAPRVWRGQVDAHPSPRPDSGWPDDPVPTHPGPGWPGSPVATGRLRRIAPANAVERAAPPAARSGSPRPRDEHEHPSSLGPGPRSRTRRTPEATIPWPPVLAWTIALFTVPMLTYLAWAWTRSGTAATTCLNVVDGACLAPRTVALNTFADAFPGMIAATALSMLIAAGLRRLDYAWRPVTIALGSAVIGAGVTTIVVSALG